MSRPKVLKTTRTEAQVMTLSDPPPEPLYGDHPPAFRLFVAGVPAPGGSKRAFAHRTTGRVIVLDDCKRNKGWRQHVAAEARRAFAGPKLTGPLEVWATFVVPRPRDHLGTGRNADAVKAKAPRHPTKKPDLTKLWRAFEDALTGVVWVDDAQIVSQRVTKAYGETPGVRVAVFRVETSPG